MDYNTWFGGLGEQWMSGEYPPAGCGLIPCEGEPAGITAEPYQLKGGEDEYDEQA